jgi:hypothetical protein
MKQSFQLTSILNPIDSLWRNCFQIVNFEVA